MAILDIKDEDRFFLEPAFIAEFEGRQPEWGPLGYVTYKRTYARPIENNGTEEYWQTIKRVVEGVYSVQKWHCHRNHLPWSDRKAQRSAQEMYRLMWEFKFVPPGRGLWMMGTKYIEEHGSTALFNCSFVSTDDTSEFSRPYAFLMDFSMLGVGVGFDTKGAGKWTIEEPKTGEYTHVVDDSREGWVTLIAKILDAYVGRTTIPSEIDYSQVRPSGVPIKTFGGIAAGPEPLMQCVERVRAVLDRNIGQSLTTTTIVDLMNIIGVCVVSGNVRRSAELALGDPADQSFLELKDPEQHGDELISHRWASNNSLLATVGMDYSGPAELTAKNGEPGYVWMENSRRYGRLIDPPNSKADPRAMGFNPCAEIALESYETCNLAETFPSRHATYEEYERTLKYAYLYTKTVTLIPTHNKWTNRVQMRNRRIGLSMSGIVQSMHRHGRRQFLQWCDTGYAYVRSLDEKYSDWLAIPRSIKVTTVKPSGSVSLLPGVTPGVHFEHSEYYNRTIRVAKTSPLVSRLRTAGYRIEDDVYDPSGYVVYFPVHAAEFDRAKADVSIWEQVENAAQMQAYWADNAVSVTVTFKPEEAADIPRILQLYETRLKSISFLPLEDHGYAQAPYQTINREEYEAATAVIIPIEFGDDTHEALDMYCDGEACLLPSRKTEEMVAA